ncbi:hypothetical protein QNZ20_004099 [Escherichia coli]|nr:hypothetical protein [Escherichia coli]ELO3217578.1 hypothetical protein [Escherichia coli]ELS7836720.1 hypothetical protein [Escherichia coli]ELT9961309.1 hypothetical protein [Escherichia coli]HAG8443622.1 hypothetical protein [Escherichia coli]
MGNYSYFETDFVQRTLALIDQYNEMIEVLGKPFREQYNYTLTLNCLLGLIVLPKERALSFLPADRLTRQLKAEMGLHESQLPGPEMNLRELIHKMRNSVAHFCVQVESASDAHLVDWIVFRESSGRWRSLRQLQRSGAFTLSEILCDPAARQYGPPSSPRC